MSIHFWFSTESNETVFARPIKHEERGKDKDVYYRHARKVHHAEKKKSYDL